MRVVKEKETSMKYGYLRTSTRKQNLHRQTDGLKARCDTLHIEKGVSATAKTRPVFEQLMRDMKQGDSLVVWDLDRAFRSTIDALITAKDLRRRGIAFQVVSMNIDTTTPHGMYAYTIWAAGCELERAVLIERTRQGLAAAKRRGTRLGRKPKLKPWQIAQIKRFMHEKPHLSRTAIARHYRVSTQTIRRALQGYSDMKGATA